jgi:diguanylate cyclase (GGDEF)-like protein
VGGEEFVAILPETAMPGARTLGERLVAAVAALSLDSGPTVTISVGAAELTPGDDLDNLMIRADQCLYRAKAQGRNRLVAGAGD